MAQNKRPFLPNNNLPLRPFSFVGRAMEIETIQKILLPYPHSQFPIIEIVGLGGIGKTALALEIAYRYLDSELDEYHRFDSIVWISQNRSVLTSEGILSVKVKDNAFQTIVETIFQVHNRPDLVALPVDAQTEAAYTELGKSRHLLIIDSFESFSSEKALRFLRDLPAPTKAIITSRESISGIFTLRLAGFHNDEAVEFIKSQLLMKNLNIPLREIEKLFQVSAGNPLAIIWIVSQLSLGVGVDVVVNLFDKNRQNNLTRFIFDTAIDKIKGRPSYKVLLSLALLGGSGNRRAIKFITSLSDSDRDDGIAELLDLSLINRERDSFALSPITMDYVQGFIREELSMTSNGETLESWTYFLSQSNINKERDELDEKFDIFLAHNSKDKPAVQSLARELRKRKIKPWVDTEQIRPGTLFQTSITFAINDVKTVAVIIGESGVGNFQSLEIKTFISKAVDAGIPIIPILLPGIQSINDETLLFLREFQWISFSSLDDQMAYDLLEWGITGKKPRSLSNRDD